ncbi:exonuclease SbcCD subunit D C-terminal domain-containing protein [Zoogloea sp.]|uniref:exonuclease SbcCD subunit D C-terminal domain-containing protein n=1 Tax=Zoogloea sp. TaxID=49181 RepID=UPI0035B10C13
MRLLHTSDWHLGQSLHQFERSAEHGIFLDWLLHTLEAEAIDALLVAGDIFDHANPSAQAQGQFYRFLSEARRRVPHLNMVMIAGNHDSPARLEAAAPLLALVDAGVYGQLERDDPDAVERILHPLRDAEGQIRAWCIAMPFLRPADLPRGVGEEAYLGGVGALYQQALARAEARRSPDQAIIALGHCHVAGGQVSEESERRILIGGAEALPASIFPPSIAYVALGHLHLPQQVAGDPTRRYCGSPLPMSFSERNYPHQVLVVDLVGAAVKEVRSLRVPRPVQLLTVPAQPAPLTEVLAALRALDVAPMPDALQPYLLVRVLLTHPEPSLRVQIEQALAGKPVRLARIETRYPAREAQSELQARSVDELHALAPQDFFDRLYTHRFGNAPSAELQAAFAELVDASNAA